MSVDTIGNTSNRYLEPGGGTDFAIHKATRLEFTEYYEKL